MLQAQQSDNIIRFPTLPTDRQACRIVPDVVRNLTSSELKKLGPLDKALVTLVFSMRNLASGRIDVSQAEQEAQRVIEILKKRFNDT